MNETWANLANENAGLVTMCHSLRAENVRLRAALQEMIDASANVGAFSFTFDEAADFVLTRRAALAAAVEGEHERD